MEKFVQLYAKSNSGNLPKLSSTVNLTPPRELKHCRGFTLAEILITLTVIGVIAALTIPTLLQNTNQAELKATWKKEFADLNQATISIVNDAGGTFKGSFSNGVDARDKYLSKLSYIKSCSGSRWEGCWHIPNESSGYDGTPNPVNFNIPGAILSNGTLITFLGFNPDCTTNWGDDFNFCGELVVDVNGFKKPNAYGKDIFAAFITENLLLPRGAHESFTDCIGVGSESGISCSATYLYE